jgi:hypothetical protein
MLKINIMSLEEYWEGQYKMSFYEYLLAYLGARTVRPVAPQTWLCREQTYVTMRYYQTDMLTFFPAQSGQRYDYVVLSAGNYWTSGLVRRYNALLNLEITHKQHVWHSNHGDGYLRNGMSFALQSPIRMISRGTGSPRYRTSLRRQDSQGRWRIISGGIPFWERSSRFSPPPGWDPESRRIIPE